VRPEFAGYLRRIERAAWIGSDEGLRERFGMA
jgi:hypothetical protein